MKKYIFYADTHIMGPKENEKVTALLNMEKNRENVFLLGDIVDVKNAKKSRLKHARELVLNLKKICLNRYAIGNHECMQAKWLHVHGNLGIMHGHTLFYSPEKVDKWASKKGGIKSLKWILWRLSLSFKTKRGTFKFKEDKVKQWIEEHMIPNGITTLVFGHTHTKKVVKAVQTVNGQNYTIINVPMGRTELEIKC